MTTAAIPSPARVNMPMNGLLAGVDGAPRVDGHDDHQGAHVEEQDADRDGVDGPRQVLFRVLGLGGGGAHQFDAGESEDGDLEAEDEAEHAVREHAAVVPHVGEVGFRAGRRT